MTKKNKINELIHLLESAKTKTREIVDSKGTSDLWTSYEFVGWYLDLILHYIRRGG